ncbi:hypothetical protein B484DRAFT_121142 [Ochromonadaceae sp. CCMP2298]|nr:hypothetical protein B484DRAFT_121142 [Ochromonadaceae sp. CCMP2298]
MFGLEGGSLVLEEGPMLQIESEHPYRHNTNEYTTVSVPGAVSYCIRFDERTRTKPIYDFVKFYESETHTDYFGCGKYSGGTGMGTRLALIIPASKFILHFKTNGSLSDWGFCMQIVPTLSSHIRQLQLETAGIPSISETGRSASMRRLWPRAPTSTTARWICCRTNSTSRSSRGRAPGARTASTVLRTSSSA